jgi:hypothetical protein
MKAPAAKIEKAVAAAEEEALAMKLRMMIPMMMTKIVIEIVGGVRGMIGKENQRGIIRRAALMMHP